MPVTHHKVTSIEQLYDLWEAGLVYANGRSCEFPGSPFVISKESILEAWRSRTLPKWFEAYTYALEE